MIRIVIANEQRQVKLPRRRLARLVREVLKGEGIVDADISLAFIGDVRMARLNETYLSHAGPTDVLTFPLGDVGALIGEIVISAETAARVAKELGHSVDRELTLYVVHGCLHLCGYDDRSAKERRRMRVREKHYLNKASVEA